MSETKDTEIITLNTKERPPVALKKKDFIHDCRHHDVVVDEKTRTVGCGKCGAQLDPIQVLIELAYRYREVDYKLRQMKEYEEKVKRQNERSQKTQEPTVGKRSQNRRGSKK